MKADKVVHLYTEEVNQVLGAIRDARSLVGSLERSGFTIDVRGPGGLGMSLEVAELILVESMAPEQEDYPDRSAQLADALGLPTPQRPDSGKTSL